MINKLTFSLIISFIICFGGLNAITNFFSVKTLHLDVDLSAIYSMWDPAIKNTEEDGNFIESETLGEASLDFKGHLEYKGYSIFKIDYLFPLIDIPEMRNIIEYNSSDEAGIEKFKYYFVIDPIMNAILSKREWKYLRYLTQWKYEYQRKRYITNAKCNNQFYYISRNATYNNFTGDIDGGEYVMPGTKMTWNTEIIEYDITLKILETMWDKLVSITVNNKKIDLFVPVQLRMGYFSCSQKQPARGIFSYSGFPSIMDVHLKASGFVFKVVTINEEAQGMNVDFHAKMSGSSIKSAAFDLYKAEFNSDAWGSYAAMGLDFWYNIRFSSNCLLTIGSDNELNAFLIEVPTDNDDEESELRWRLRQWPTDFYIRFGYRF